MELETRQRLFKTQKDLERSTESITLMTLNSKLNFEEAKLKKEYLSWKKF